MKQGDEKPGVISAGKQDVMQKAKLDYNPTSPFSKTKVKNIYGGEKPGGNSAGWWSV